MGDSVAARTGLAAAFVLAVCWSLFFQARTAHGQAPFLEVTQAAGVTEPQEPTIPGPAWGDYDRDGCPDLFLPDSSGPNLLYRNNCDGTFSISPHSNQVALDGQPSRGAAFGDYDNDGWLDLFISSEGIDSLFRNEAGQGFSNVTVGATLGDPRRATAVAWGDYDRDGRIDLFVGNYYDATHPDARDSLYRNNGDGTFTDVTSYFQPAGRLRGPTFAVRWLDYDNDGDLDLYVVNDHYFGNVLWRNDGPGCGGWCWSDVSVATGAHRPVDGMGIAAADYDLDGDLDLYFSSTFEQVLLRSRVAQGQATFEEATDEVGVNSGAIGWGSVFFDYDNDGWPDLYLATMDPLPQFSNRLFRNRGDGTFADLSSTSGADDLGPTMGVVQSDYDGDGWLDLVIGNLWGSYKLFRNQGTVGTGNGWLAVALEGGGSVSRDAIGARVYVTTSDGRVQFQEVHSGTSFCSGNDMTLHFGLGAATVHQVEIRWPDGLVEVTSGVERNQRWHRRHPVVFADGFESGDTAAWAAGGS